MRVFLATHSYYETDRREKLQILAATHGVQLTLLIPRTWMHSLGKLVFKPRGDERFRVLFKKAVLAGRNNLYFYPLLPFYLLFSRPQVVHCEEEPFSFTTCLSILLGKLLGAKTVFFTWQNLPMDLPFPYALFNRIALQLADVAVAGNPEGREILKKQGFTRPVFVIPQLGIPADFGKTAEPGPLRESLGCQGLVAGFVGRITRLKGIDTLLRAVSLMKEEVTALIIGRGDHLAALKGLAADLRITDGAVFIDTVDHDEIPRYLKAMDVLVLPSITGKDWKEQFGQVLIEAMSCGTPVIGSDSGAIPAVIGDAGLIFPEGDARALAGRLRMTMDQDVRNGLRRRGLERVRDYFTHERVAAATYEVYQFLLGEKTEPSILFFSEEDRPR